ncbi:C-terminal binding protein [Halobaculum gomorrense]|uniref:D-3-phosphoglycerate dehydrogenase n=1 Tax=Halobaculum gomorrense TaxID=43928 RepID=A0A1M5K9S9_9EURY|nr:C-terminal binding protein [Halobaculum gomorrense]SHG49498.1 D-3-phosphoglycerate dehydrogenase [Halobaculum gomorrense]
MSDADRLVVVSDDPRYDPERLRESLGCRVEPADLSTPEALRTNAADADAVVVNVGSTVPRSVIEELDLTVVARGAVGLDGINVSAAAEHGVQVIHVPDYCLEEVADHAVGLFTALARGIPAYADRAAAGDWDWQPPYPIGRLADCTVGVVSFGPIARRFADRVLPLVDDVLVADPYVDDAVIREHDAEPVGFDALCRRADHLSVHAPLTEETRGMVDEDAFDALPPHAVVVNTGRGGVVDEEALATALADGSVAAAGLDVLAAEPPAADHSLFGRDDVLVTPHAGWYSAAAERDLNDAIAGDLARAFRGEEPRGLVDPDADWL